VLRDKDDNTAWTTACDGTLEQRTFYLNNWRGDVVGLVTSTGYQAESVRYSPYGTPFGYPGGDCDADGDADSADATVISGWISGSTYDVRGDLDLDGDVDSTDSTLFAARYSGATAGRGVLSSEGNQGGFAGMERWLSRGWYARARLFLNESGKWGTRDPLEYAFGMDLYAYVGSSPLLEVDPLGLGPWGWLKKKWADAKDTKKQADALGGVWAWNDAYQIGLIAKQHAKDKYPPGSKDGFKQDAYRHCTWQCTLAGTYGEEKARKIGDIHEEREPFGPDTVMDQHNNAVGRKCASHPTKTCRECCEEKLDDGGLILRPTQVVVLLTLPYVLKVVTQFRTAGL